MLKIKTIVSCLIFLSITISSCTNESEVIDIYERFANLPPSPREAGKVTLEGIDSDHDGIRDDVQIALHYEFGDSEILLFDNRKKAKELQEIFDVYQDKQASLNHFRNFYLNPDKFYNAERAACFHEFLANDLSDVKFKEWYSLLDRSEVLRAVINTEARENAYQRYLENIHDDLANQYNTDPNKPTVRCFKDIIKVTKEKAVEIARKEASSRGYDLDKKIESAEIYSYAWNLHVPDKDQILSMLHHELIPGDGDIQTLIEISKTLSKLKDKTYWTIHFSPAPIPNKIILDGGFSVFIHAYSGEVLDAYPF